MQIQSTQHTVETGITATPKQAKIKVNEIAFKVLAQNMYKDPVSAILRELGQNCLDSHKAAGNPDPFTIQLPSIALPILVFDDNGIGMSPEFIEDNENGYLSVFDSTKRGENNSSGGWGVGRMSIFAIADQFTLESRWNGNVYTYNMFISESGVPSLIKIGEAPTADRNGVKITVSVPLNHINDFNTKIANVYQWYDIIPKFTNLYLKVAPFNLDTEYKNPGSWYITNKIRSYIWMGCYAYELDEAALSSRLTEQQKLLLNCGVVIKANVGDIAVNVSREAVNYDEKSYTFIINALDRVLGELEPILVKELCNGKTPYHSTANYRKFDYNFKYLIKTFKKSLSAAVIDKLDGYGDSRIIIPHNEFGIYYLSGGCLTNKFSANDKGEVDEVEKKKHLDKYFPYFSQFYDSFIGKANYSEVSVNSLIIINDNNTTVKEFRNNIDEYLFRGSAIYADKTFSQICYIPSKFESDLKAYLVKCGIDDLFTFDYLSKYYTPVPKVPRSTIYNADSVSTLQTEIVYGRNVLVPKLRTLACGKKFYYVNVKEYDKLLMKVNSKLDFETQKEECKYIPIFTLKLIDGFDCNLPILVINGRASNLKYFKYNKEHGTNLIPLLRRILNSNKLADIISCHDISSKMEAVCKLVNRIDSLNLNIKVGREIRFYTDFMKNISPSEILSISYVFKGSGFHSKIKERMLNYITKKNPLLSLINADRVHDTIDLQALAKKL